MTEAEKLVRELKALHACFERGLELDRDMRFNVNGNGPGSSTGFYIDHSLLWRAAEHIRKQAAMSVSTATPWTGTGRAGNGSDM
jgi:hypothetical protein